MVQNDNFLNGGELELELVGCCVSHTAELWDTVERCHGNTHEHSTLQPGDQPLGFDSSLRAANKEIWPVMVAELFPVFSFSKYIY